MLPGNPPASLTEFIQFASAGIPEAARRCSDVFVNTAGRHLRHILGTPFGIGKMLFGSRNVKWLSKWFPEKSEGDWEWHRWVCESWSHKRSRMEGSHSKPFTGHPKNPTLCLRLFYKHSLSSGSLGALMIPWGSRSCAQPLEEEFSPDSQPKPPPTQLQLLPQNYPGWLFMGILTWITFRCLKILGCWKKTPQKQNQSKPHKIKAGLEDFFLWKLQLKSLWNFFLTENSFFWGCVCVCFCFCFLLPKHKKISLKLPLFEERRQQNRDFQRSHQSKSLQGLWAGSFGAEQLWEKTGIPSLECQKFCSRLKSISTNKSKSWFFFSWIFFP